MPSKIEDYALIGDCHSAALVSRAGAIDWLTFPRFDSPACFAALLGSKDNGHWTLRPEGEIREIRRRYRGDTLVLETEFVTPEGAVTLIDFMPPRTSHSDVIRIVRCTRGEVRMETELTIRFDYGWIVPWVNHVEDGIRAIAGPDKIYCRSEIELRGENLHTVAEFTLKEGEEKSFVLAWTHSHDPEAPRVDANQALRETEQWWRDWSERCTYTGRWRDAVMRSLLTLKALTYLPTGGMVAAATTSLPEQLGGVRNWDYRYCWVRDATFTLYSLMVGGYVEEACAWREWLVRAVAGTPSELQIMYGVAGERRLTEWEVSWLSGYEGAAPVRVGNAAHQQRQWDVYGEIMDAMYLALKSGLPASQQAWNVQRSLLRYLEKHWREPDEGIWETRGPQQQFTHSKAMAWVAVDRGIKSIEQFGLEGDLERWRNVREEIAADIWAHGFDPGLNSFVQSYGSKHADASLLVLPSVGFLDAGDPRMTGTVDFIRRELLHDGFVHRYKTEQANDGLPPGEGVFLLCTFWLADNYALQGRRKEAEELFERLLSLRNDVGLLSEQYDPAGRRLLGNFPQAFSHIGLINTARNLSAGGGPAEDRPKR